MLRSGIELRNLDLRCQCFAVMLRRPTSSEHLFTHNPVTLTPESMGQYASNPVVLIFCRLVYDIGPMNNPSL